MRVLIVLTSHDQLGETGKKTGFWLEELASPYYRLKDAGATITLASPKGGQPPLDPKSDAPDAQTEATRRFKEDAEAQRALASTRKLDEMSAEGFDAVFFPGGHGPLWRNHARGRVESVSARAHDQREPPAGSGSPRRSDRGYAGRPVPRYGLFLVD